MQELAQELASKEEAAGSLARLIVNDAFSMGGGWESGAGDPPRKIIKNRGPECPLIASNFLVSGGRGRGWTD